MKEYLLRSEPRRVPSAGTDDWGRTVPGWAVVSAGLSPALLTAAWLIAGLLQPDSYSPVRETVSVLAGQGGTHPWIMTSGLILVSGCHLVTAAGLVGVRVIARLLLIVAGACSAGIAAAPVSAAGPTVVHLAWTALGAVTIAVWPAFAAQRARSAPLVVSTGVSAAATVAFTVLLGWVILETRGGADLGLAERLASSTQASWPFVVAAGLRRSATRRRRDQA